MRDKRRRWARKGMLAGSVLATSIAVRTSRLAAQGNPSDSAAQLGTLVVSASRGTTTVQQMALHTSVIPRAEILKSPARTVDQMLRTVSGMNLSGTPYYASDPTGQQTRLRGVTNSKVLVLLDGVPMLDPFYSTTQWFKVPLESIDRIEVVRGGGSSLWGNLAVAGVVNIITRKPTGQRGQLDVSYQSHGAEQVAASKDLSLGSLRMRVDGALLHTDGYQTVPAAVLPSVPGHRPSPALVGSLQMSAYYTPGDALSAFLRAGYHRQREVLGGYDHGVNRQRSPDLAAGLTRKFGTARADISAWAQWVDFDKQNGAACFLAAPAKCTTTAVGSPLVQYANSVDANPYHELGASATLSKAFITFPSSVQFGIDVRRLGGSDSAVTYDRPTGLDASTATINRVNVAGGAQQFIGAFSQFTMFPTPALTVALGVRYDYWANLDGHARMTRFDAGQPQATSGGPISDSHQGSLNPAASIRFAVSPALAVRGAAYHAFRAPGLNNLYRSYSTTNFISIANPRLDPETLTGTEIGADFDTPTVSMSATAFRYDTRDLIAAYRIADAATAPDAVLAVCGTALQNCPAVVTFNTNGQDGRSQGVELTGRWRLARNLMAGAGYSWTHSHYTSSTTSDPIDAQLGGVPQHLITASLTWQPNAVWSSYLSLRHSGAMYLDVKHTLPQPAFNVVDVSSSYRMSNRLQLYGSVVNLTNTIYSDNPATSAAAETLGLPRTITGGVRWSF